MDEYRKKKKTKEDGTHSGTSSLEKDQNKEKDTDKDKETVDAKENGEKGDKSEKEEGEESGAEGAEELDENSKREDRVAQAGLEAIMREYAFELAKEPPASKNGKFLVV